MHAVKIKYHSGECGRAISGSNGSRVQEKCSNEIVTINDINEDPIVDPNEPTSSRPYPLDKDSWKQYREFEKRSLGEYYSSYRISGSHGEYALNKGHFVCFDPYPDGVKVQD